MASPRVLAPGIRSGAGDIALPDEEAGHLTRVLRLGAGDHIRVFDGAGREWHATIASAGRDGVRVALGDAIDPVPEPPVRLTLAIGLLKGAQMDDVVRDATALGAAVILPIDTAHVAVAAAGRRSTAARNRWRRVAVAAAKQCGRAVVPAVDAVVDLATALDAAAARGDLLVWCAEPATGVGADRPIARPERGVTVWIGPEGGWRADEAAALRARGAVPITVGPRTLRASTMPAVVLSVLWTRWGW